MEKLTEGERAVLIRLVQGKTRTQVANELETSLSSVARVLTSIYAKTGARVTITAAAIALVAGELSPKDLRDE